MSHITLPSSEMPDVCLEVREDFIKLLDTPQETPNRVELGIRQYFADMVDSLRLYEIIKIKRLPEETHLTLANMWRLIFHRAKPSLFPDIFKSAFVTLHSFDLFTGCWWEQSLRGIVWRKYENPWRQKPRVQEEAPNPDVWPDLHCLYPRRTNPCSYLTLLGCVVEKVLAASPISTVKPIHDFFGFLLYRIMRLPYKYPVQFMEMVLERHIWDQELLEMLQSLHGHSGEAVFLSQYLDWIRLPLSLRDDWRRIKRESPNFLPLLNLIPHKLWKRADLLRNTTMQREICAFQNVSAGALRWLRKAPAETLGILHWCFKIRPRSMPQLIEALAGLQTKGPLPLEIQWIVFPKICFLVDGLSHVWTEEHILIKRLAGLLARHIEAAWTDGGPGTATLKKLRRSSENLKTIIDWFLASGRHRGLPDKNSTWRALKRHSEQWHKEIWRAEMAEKENVRWESVLGSMTINEIKITPLVTASDLYTEGYEMRHCVSTYTQRCLQDGCRIFSLTAPNGERSTLSLVPYNNSFVIDQHYGPDNSPVSRVAAKAALEISRLYTRKYLAANGTVALV